MKNKIMSNFLPIFYTFCALCLIIGGISFYKINTEKKDRLLTIEEKVDIKDIGESLKLELNDNNIDNEVIYEIENEDIVKIDENGVLVGVNEGSTTVTVTNKETNEKQTIVVNVGDNAIKEYEENKNTSNNSGLGNSNSNTSTNPKPSSSPSADTNSKPTPSATTNPKPSASPSPSPSNTPKPSSTPSTGSSNTNKNAKPLLSVSSQYNNTWSTQNVIVLTGTDQSGKGIESYQYTYNKNATEVGTNENTKWVKYNNSSSPSYTTTITKEGTSTIYFRVCSKNNKCSDVKSVTNKIDRTAPSQPIVKAYSYKYSSINGTPSTYDGNKMNDITNTGISTDYIFAFASNSNDGSGSGNIKYYLNVSGTETNINNQNINYFNIKKPGKNNISFKACDLVGNCSNEVKITLERKHSILFVGNSKTQGTCSPKTSNYVQTDYNVALRTNDFMTSAGYNTHTQYAAECGKSLNYIYSNNTDAKNKIKNYTYDYLILQEQTATLCKSSTYSTGVNNIVNEVKKNNPNVKVFIRAVWTSKDNDYVSSAGESCSFKNAKTNTESIANQIGATVIYDGNAMYASTSVNVWYDNLHQNKHGAYLSAACIYKKLTGRNPLTSTYNYNNLSNYKTMLTLANDNC